MQDVARAATQRRGGSAAPPPRRCRPAGQHAGTPASGRQGTTEGDDGHDGAVAGLLPSRAGRCRRVVLLGDAAHALTPTSARAHAWRRRTPSPWPPAPTAKPMCRPHWPPTTRPGEPEPNGWSACPPSSDASHNGRARWRLACGTLAGLTPAGVYLRASAETLSWSPPAPRAPDQPARPTVTPDKQPRWRPRRPSCRPQVRQSCGGKPDQPGRPRGPWRRRPAGSARPHRAT